MRHVIWSFSRIENVPIIQAIGEGNNNECIGILLRSAVDIIENAERFKGKPYIYNRLPKSNAKIVTYFSLFFPSKRNLNDFIEAVNKGNLFSKGNF